MKLNIYNNKQSGFSILAILLIIVISIVGISIWTMTGQTNINKFSTNITDAQVAAIMNESQAIKQTYDQFIYNGASVNNIVFIPNQPHNPSIYNLLDPKFGVSINLKIDSRILKNNYSSPVGMWVYNPTGFKGYNVGTTASDPIILFTGIKLEVCKAINKSIYGNLIVLTTFEYSFSEDIVAGATITNPTSTVSINGSYSHFVNNWTKGCFNLSGNLDDNVYFQVLKEI